MHNLAHAPASSHRYGRTHLSAIHQVRGALLTDVAEIHELVAVNTAKGLLLPRCADDIALAIDDYVVVTDSHGRVLACAALQGYSPSLAEVGSVAVLEEAQGEGLGSIVVHGAEAVARRRGFEELFALTTAERFFESLGYERTSISRYPEKLARYEALAERGVQIVPKSCYRKLTFRS